MNDQSQDLRLERLLHLQILLNLVRHPFWVLSSFSLPFQSPRERHYHLKVQDSRSPRSRLVGRWNLDCPPNSLGLLILLTVVSLQALANPLSTSQTCVKLINLLKLEASVCHLLDPQVVRLADVVDTILDSTPTTQQGMPSNRILLGHRLS